MLLSASDATRFAHPLRAPPPDPTDANGTPLIWTPDIDDMLILTGRQHAFDFGAVATHIQR